MEIAKIAFTVISSIITGLVLVLLYLVLKALKDEGRAENNRREKSMHKLYKSDMRSLLNEAFTAGIESQKEGSTDMKSDKKYMELVKKYQLTEENENNRRSDTSIQR